MAGTGNSTALLLSGGVDSAVALHLLCEQGARPDLFYIKIGSDANGGDELTCTAEEDLLFCRMLSRRYGLHLEVVDLHADYWERVMGYVIEKVRQGLTPNPDVMCNRLIKFGCFNQQVGHLYHTIATGHYADVVVRDGIRWLATAADPVKDQTDFLAQIDSLQLAKLQFPIGRLRKDQVRAIARQAALPNARRKDSQGICFLGKISYNDLIRHYLGECEGWVVEQETGKKIGRHHGHWFHTIGQRKGLGFGGGPWYVVRKDVAENVLYVSRGSESAMRLSDGFVLRDFHFISGDCWQGSCSPVEVSFKIRHTTPAMRGTLLRSPDGSLAIRSSCPLQGVAPGQFGVVYDADWRICIGSGEIAVARD